ncbi:MAG: hypothetical protein ACE5PV_02255 [Candidatus Poribacteria bacterium]
MSKLAINGGGKTVTIPQKDKWGQVTEYVEAFKKVVENVGEIR